MTDLDAAMVRLFSRLREDLRGETGIGLALKAQGSDVTLRVRSQRAPDPKRPFFAIVVGERDRAYRVSYKPSGVPLADCEVTIIDFESLDDLLVLVRRYLHIERRRSIDYPGS